MTESTREQIEKRLTAGLNPSYIEVIDESADHIGHPGAQSGGGHYRVKLTASVLNGKKRLQQHRLIHSYLDDLFQQAIHALAIEIIKQPPPS